MLDARACKKVGTKKAASDIVDDIVRLSLKAFANLGVIFHERVILMLNCTGDIS